MNTYEEFLRSMTSACSVSPIVGGRRLVTGEGQQVHPDIMLIGEAPGAQEEQQGRPFVGKAGKNLDGFLERLELTRSALWVSNVVKVRPSKVSPKGTVSNRPPNRQELSFFIPWLHIEIGLIRPQIVVTLGNTALHAILGDDVTIGDLHGKPMHVTVADTWSGILFPLYHPASIIYNRSLSAVWDEDLAALKTYLTAN